MLIMMEVCLEGTRKKNTAIKNNQSVMCRIILLSFWLMFWRTKNKEKEKNEWCWWDVWDKNNNKCSNVSEEIRDFYIDLTRSKTKYDSSIDKHQEFHFFSSIILVESLIRSIKQYWNDYNRIRSYFLFFFQSMKN